ncbi:MAG: DUF1800 domain-containing protein [Steroidobacteraceae bacterium]
MTVLRTCTGLAVAALIALLGACSGGSGGGSPPPPPPPAITKAEAFQFLNQTTFGATEVEAQRVISLGYAAWIDDQIARTPSRQLPFLQSLPAPMVGDFELQADRVDIWFRNVVNGDDQLRQRVAFALSQIMVVSQNSALVNQPFGLASYYDLLAERAFGNYRDLMEAVTLHPAMGVYLSMLGNEKPNAALNIRPDENYARELMQLFTIGLVELNDDGSVKVDGSNQPIATYDQSIIEGFAHVYTGWTYAGAPGFRQARPTRANQVIPMQSYPGFHDTGSKKLLGGTVLPANQTAEQDLDAALDNIFNHPNVGPFVARQLIQRLVTSNPSPAYVQRIARVFNNNGSGTRGDLKAVVRALLLDAEARNPGATSARGKLKEPVIRLTQLWRAYDGKSQSGKYPLIFAGAAFGEGPLQSPSVFNFYSPAYSPPGELRDQGLVAPEMQIATEYLNANITNYMLDQMLNRNSAATGLGADDIVVDISAEMNIAGDSGALADSVAQKLLGRGLEAPLRAAIVQMLDNFAPTDTVLRAADAIYLVATSPAFAYQD